MRVVFMGTPTFSVPSLLALCDAHEVALVLTRPDAVRGRGRTATPSPVKEAALERGIRVLEARRIDEGVLGAIREAAPDVIAVAAFGAILPDAVLELAPLGCVNVHASLLPRWRGAAPIQRAILAGDDEVGISIMRMAHDLDSGATCAQASVPVGGKGCAELTAELARLGARELIPSLERIANGSVAWTEQDEALVTYAHKVEKQEILLDPQVSAIHNLRRVRASLDTSPARLVVDGRGVRVMQARLSGEAAGQGEVRVLKGRVLLGCAGGTLEPTAVKPDGKREMDVAAWAAGLRNKDSRWEHV